MDAELECVEIQSTVRRDHDFAVKNATRGQLPPQGFHQLRKVSVQRFLVAALNQNFFSVAKDQRAKSIPLRLKQPIFSRGNLIHPFGKHRQKRRLHWKMHVSCYIAAEHRWLNAALNVSWAIETIEEIKRQGCIISRRSFPVALPT